MEGKFLRNSPRLGKKPIKKVAGKKSFRQKHQSNFDLRRQAGFACKEKQTVLRRAACRQTGNHIIYNILSKKKMYLLCCNETNDTCDSVCACVFVCVWVWLPSADTQVRGTVHIVVHNWCIGTQQLRCVSIAEANFVGTLSSILMCFRILQLPSPHSDLIN